MIDTTSDTHQGEWCLEAVFRRGAAGRIRDLVYRLRDFDAVGRVKIVSLEARRSEGDERRTVIAREQGRTGSTRTAGPETAASLARAVGPEVEPAGRTATHARKARTDAAAGTNTEEPQS